jgi:glycosyltransferase involved in cell wall biosynthesis
MSKEEARSRFGVPANAFLLVAVGRLAEQKNYPFMITLVERLDDVLLLIAGDGPLRKELDGKIVERGLGWKVRLLGSVARSDVPDLLRAADVFLQTSKYEGQSNSVLEALHALLPVVAPDIPEYRETIAEPDGSVAGALIAPDDLDGWIATLEGLRDNSAASQAARSVARRRAQVFQYERMVADFERVLFQPRMSRVEDHARVDL